MADVSNPEKAARASLESECHELRAQLKEWEKAFAETHSGRKPAKEDIKSDARIAARYKIYNRRRDLLYGKKERGKGKEKEKEGYSAVLTPSSTHRHAKDGKDAGDGGMVGDPRSKPIQRSLFATPTRQKKKSNSYSGRDCLLPETHPSVLDPYDSPLPRTSSQSSPHHDGYRNAIGPTPQRDGTMLGLFDLLSSSAGGGGTPSSASAQRKRKMGVSDEYDDGLDGGVVRTPSRKLVKKGELDSPYRRSGGSYLGDGQRRHLRTPASEGKKFMLSQFFSTPSAIRFADGTKIQGTLDGKIGLDRTPLRNTVLSPRPGGPNVSDRDAHIETTPTFLRRATSFNQRLFGASGSTPRRANPNSGTNNATSPTTVLKIPSLRPIKGKPLSEILRDLRHMEDEKEDDDDEDGMDALHEMEENEVNALTGDSQAGAGPPKADGKIWKKKGQKRTTRRVNMRPAIAPQRKDKVGTQKHKHTRGEVDSADDVNDIGDDYAKVIGIQQPATDGRHRLDVIEGENRDLEPLADREDADVLGNCKMTLRDDNSIYPPASSSSSSSSTGASFDSKCDELAPITVKSNSEFSGRRRSNHASKNGGEVSVAKAPAMLKENPQNPSEQEKRAKFREEGKGKKKEKRERKGINPNAPSNMNFRTLKLRNRHSSKKSGGGGRSKFNKGRR